MNQTIDPGFSDVLVGIEEEGWFTSTVTIQRFSGTLGPTGIPDKSGDNWDDLADHVDLPAMVAADIFMTNVTRSKEVRLPDTIAEVDTLHVLFNGLFPEIKKDDKAVVTRPNGVPVEEWDITGAECDSQAVMTRLELRRYK